MKLQVGLRAPLASGSDAPKVGAGLERVSVLEACRELLLVAPVSVIGRSIGGPASNRQKNRQTDETDGRTDRKRASDRLRIRNTTLIRVQAVSTFLAHNEMPADAAAVMTADMLAPP